MADNTKAKALDQRTRRRPMNRAKPRLNKRLATQAALYAQAIAR